MKQKTNSKLVETVKRDGNEMLKYSTSTLPCASLHSATRGAASSA